MNVANMESMFKGAHIFNQNLCTWYNISYNAKPAVSDMFLESLCADRSDPNFATNSTFCSKCNSETHIPSGNGAVNSSPTNHENNPTPYNPLPPLIVALLIGIFSFLLLSAVIVCISCWWFHRRTKTNEQTYERLQEHATSTVRAPIESPLPSTDSNVPQYVEVSSDSIVEQAFPGIVIPDAEVASEVPEAKVIRAPSQLQVGDNDVQRNQDP